MRLYFVVEGRRTEMAAYPRWLKYLSGDRLTPLSHYMDAGSPAYYLISGYGYPGILNEVPAAIQNISKAKNYDWLIVVVDADEASVAARETEVKKYVKASDLTKAGCRLKIVVQNRTIESWFLGNKRIVKQNPQAVACRQYVRFYNVKDNDPEKMPRHSDFSTHAAFHEAYLKAMLRERRLAYSKTSSGAVTTEAYFNQMLRRTTMHPTQMATFQSFINWFQGLTY